jgi:phosphatidylinositol glycan class X
VQWISSPYDLLISNSANIRKEVAIIQTKDFHNDLELSGIRMVLDETDALAPSKTLLFVKNRHHLLENKLSFEFNEPIGLHPTLKISNLSNISQSSPHSSCELFIYNTISQELFFDKYQYDTTSLTLLNSWGEHDLEAPIWKVSQFGSIQLFQVNTDQLTEKNEVEIKFHSRYLNPSQSNQFNAITPNVFWACDSRQFIDDFEEIRNNPFDSFGLGYESLFEDDTVFCHMEKDRRVLEYTIPRGDKKDFNSIQYITLGSVVIGVLYILFKITKAFIRANGTKKTISEEKKKK